MIGGSGNQQNSLLALIPNILITIEKPFFWIGFCPKCFGQNLSKLNMNPPIYIKIRANDYKLNKFK